MALFNILKKKKTEEKKTAPAAEKIPVAEKRDRKDKINSAYRILKAPHITEKATNLNSQNKYVFKIMPRANKHEVKQAIRDLYGVKVKEVRIINAPAKRKRLGKTEGWQTGYKKAIVNLAEGDKIEITPR